MSILKDEKLEVLRLGKDEREDDAVRFQNAYSHDPRKNIFAEKQQKKKKGIIRMPRVSII